MSVRGAYPQFSWSESGYRRFRECRRKHFLAVYLKHNGWEPGAQREKRLAWLMGKLVPSWSVALGSCLHERAVECVMACAAGRPLPSFADLHTAATNDLNRLYRHSRDHLGDFQRDPGHWSVLASRFYGEPWCRSDFERTAVSLKAALDALLSADDLWEKVRGAGSDGIWIPDRFFSFRLEPDGVLVYAAPDLVVRPEPERPAEIWDFKLGPTDGDVDQLLVYALALREATAFAPDPNPNARYLGRVVPLTAAATPQSRAPFAILDGDIDQAAHRIRAGVAEMRALLLDAGGNVPSGIEDFHRTTHRWRCPRCQFRGLCEPECFPISAERQTGERVP